MRRDGPRAQPRRNRRRERQRAHEQRDPQRQVSADADERPRDGPPESLPPDRGCRARASEQERDEHRRAQRLRDHGRPCGARQSPSEAEDEQRVQDQVGEVEPERDHQRRPRVLKAPERAVAHHDHEHGGRRERADAEVHQRLVQERALGAHHAEHRHGGRLQRERREEPRAEREREGVPHEAARGVTVAPSERARDERRRPVGEEVEREEGEPEHGRAHAERRQRHGAGLPHERGVHERDERVRRERAERGQREGRDLAVGGREAHPEAVGAPNVPRRPVRTDRIREKPEPP